MTTRNILAIDLGAESGRGVVGRFDGTRLDLDVVHRFPNGPTPVLDGLYWDVLQIHRENLNALRAAAATGELASVGIDTWGVDFALLGRNGTLLGHPRHYRDPHTEAYPDLAFRTVPREEIYRRTGLQFMRINSLYQLLAMKRDGSPLLEMAETLLMIPDLFHYFLTGIKANEFTDATTTQLIDPRTRAWDYELAGKFGLSSKLFGSIIAPGTVLGPLRNAVANDTGVMPIRVVAPAAHDTASAVAAVPAEGDNWAYISSGTWSLVGLELQGPCISDATLAANFTNEGGLNGTSRFLKNVMGLWLVQECRREFEKQGQNVDYEVLMQMAAAAPAFVSFIDPDDAAFLLPSSMTRAIADFCRRTNQPSPAEPAAVVRCCLESLALKYRRVLATAEELTGRKADVIHIVGGGCQNRLLCQFTADACGRPVLAGPVEATAIGNVMVQAMALKWVGSPADIREVVRRSFAVTRYEPRHGSQWEEAATRFAGVVAPVIG